MGTNKNNLIDTVLLSTQDGLFEYPQQVERKKNLRPRLIGKQRHMQWHFLVRCALVHNKVAEATNEKLINGFARFVYAEHVQHDLILHTLHTRQHVFAFFLTFTLCICMQNWIKCRFLRIYEKNKLFAVTFFLGEAGARFCIPVYR